MPVERGRQALAPDRVTAYVGEPASLLPGDVRDPAGLQIASALFTPLVRYDPDSGRLVHEVAETVTSSDQRTWTITLRPGWTFHNGEPVTAHSFAGAWNATAYGPNGWAGNPFFAGFEGYQALNPDGDESPRRRTLAGVEVVDDLTLRVTLRAPFSQFPLILGYPAFYPLPSEVIEDAGATGGYAKAPIGNGPYRIDGSPQPGQPITLRRFADYPSAPAAVRELTFRTGPAPEAAYRALLAGQLDVMPLPSAFVADARHRLGGRVVERDGSTLQSLAFPLHEPRFRDPRVRRAVSMAIDRKAITEEMLGNAYRPARSLVAPVAMGARSDPCAEACTFNPRRARLLLAEAGGWDGPLRLRTDAGGHEAWMSAVAEQLRTNLGISEVEVEAVDGERYEELLRAGDADGPFRHGWVMDYPSAQDYLEPMYARRGGFNVTGYADTRVDRLLARGNAAGSLEDAAEHYQAAEDAVLADMPAVPLWFERYHVATSGRVRDVRIDSYGRVRFHLIEIR